MPSSGRAAESGARFVPGPQAAAADEQPGPRYLKRRNPAVKCYEVEPTNAALLSGRRKKAGRHRLQGVGYMEIPPLWQPELADGVISVSDSEATRTARLLGTKEGILAGYTTGANVAAALRVARSAKRPITVVRIITDSGLKYLSTDLYIDSSTPIEAWRPGTRAHPSGGGAA